jgi:hypothetical protein
MPALRGATSSRQNPAAKPENPAGSHGGWENCPRAKGANADGAAPVYRGMKTQYTTRRISLAALRAAALAAGLTSLVAFAQEGRRDIVVQPPTPPGLPPAPSVGIEIRTNKEPPAERREEMRERERQRHERDAVWVPGYWAWREQRYAWTPGRWERPPEGRRVWVEPRWERHREGGYVFRQGYWR